MPRSTRLAMPPVDPAHCVNVRDDTHRDVDSRKAVGKVRDKAERVIGIDDPHTDFTPRQRDWLYQAYCAFAAPTTGTPPTDEQCWA